MAVTKEESLLLEQRLLLNESTINRPSVQLLGSRLSKLVGTEDGKDVSQEEEEMIRESLRLELEFKKQIRTLSGYEVEQGDQMRLEGEMTEKLKEIHQVLDELEDELSREKRIRKHKSELERKANEVELKPNKVALATKIEDRRQAIVDIQAQSEMVHQRILETKKKIESLTENIVAMHQPTGGHT